MILLPMYHHAKADRYGNSPEMLDRHFAYIAKHFNSAHPGEGSGICLTFDDAYDDFYTTAFPLIQKHNLKTILAVPTGLIDTPGYCIWDQIHELAASPLIKLAAHSHTHCNLALPADLSQEIEKPKQLLKTDIFVFPYGKYSPEALQYAKTHYRYLVRIGTACNFSWDQPLLYRIDCDRLQSPSHPFSLLSRLGYRARFCLNRLRNR